MTVCAGGAEQGEGCGRGGSGPGQGGPVQGIHQREKHRLRLNLWRRQKGGRHCRGGALNVRNV